MIIQNPDPHALHALVKLASLVTAAEEAESAVYQLAHALEQEGATLRPGIGEALATLATDAFERAYLAGQAIQAMGYPILPLNPPKP